MTTTADIILSAQVRILARNATLVGPTAARLRPGVVVMCKACRKPFIVESDGVWVTYPCGDPLDELVECSACVEGHANACVHCAYLR